MAALLIAQGAIAPECIELEVTSAVGDVDLTTVTSATLVVRLPSGMTTSWSAAIISAQVTSITLRHTFSAGEVDDRGPYVFKAHLVVPSGLIRSKPKSFDVVDQFLV